MSFVTNFLTPLIQWVVYLGLGIWFIYIIYWILSRSIPDFKFIIKYKLFRQKWDEDRVDWCMKAYDKGWGEVEITKFLLLKHYNKKEIKEIMYYFKNIVKTIEKQDKGGINKNVRIRSSDEQIKKIPSITTTSKKEG